MMSRRITLLSVTYVLAKMSISSVLLHPIAPTGLHQRTDHGAICHAGAEGGDGANPEGEEKAAPAEPEPEPEPVVQTVSVTMYRLHVNIDQLPQNFSNSSTFYFLRNTEEPLTIENMETELEYGMLAEGPSLQTLRQLIEEVYLPLLAQEVGVDESAAHGLLSMGSKASSSQRELLSNMQKFLGQVRRRPGRGAGQQPRNTCHSPVPAQCF